MPSRSTSQSSSCASAPPPAARARTLRAGPAFLRAEDLLEQVRDEHADPFTNTVTVTIGWLRHKLGDPPVITTKPGVGYRIVDRPVQDPATHSWLTGLNSANSV